MRKLCSSTRLPANFARPAHSKARCGWLLRRLIFCHEVGPLPISRNVALRYCKCGVSVQAGVFDCIPLLVVGESRSAIFLSLSQKGQGMKQQRWRRLGGRIAAAAALVLVPTCAFAWLVPHATPPPGSDGLSAMRAAFAKAKVDQRPADVQPTTLEGFVYTAIDVEPPPPVLKSPPPPKPNGKGPPPKVNLDKQFKQVQEAEKKEFALDTKQFRLAFQAEKLRAELRLDRQITQQEITFFSTVHTRAQVKAFQAMIDQERQQFNTLWKLAEQNFNRNLALDMKLFNNALKVQELTFKATGSFTYMDLII